MHDTALCAWWKPPFCNKAVYSQDLCASHYNTGARQGSLAPRFIRITRPHQTISRNEENTFGFCYLCGPVPLVKGECRNRQISRGRERRTGWTEETYDETLIEQGNRCACCGEAGGNEPREMLQADHCHSQNLPRELLCSPCNRILGHAQDDPKRLEAALAYARKWEVV